jgi:flagellar basal body-associated protein FliL
MKAIIVILILAGAVFALWHFQDDIFKAIEGGGDDDGGSSVVDGGGDPTPAGGNDKPDGGNNDNKGGNNDDKADDRAIAKAYPLPNFRPIEELVGNWTSVPPTAFPRKIVIKTPVSYPLAGGRGSSGAKAGSEALALSQAGSKLLIAPRPGSTLRAQIELDQTDFKEVLAAAYDDYKIRKKEEVLKQRKRAKLVGLAPPAPKAGSGGKVTASTDRKPASAKLAEYEKKAGKMPTRSADGTVPLMVVSIKAGDVTEIKLGEISHWGPITFEEVEGQPYWTGTVNYKTTSLFGTFPTEAMALIKNGKVVEWRYTGSLEEVP